MRTTLALALLAAAGCGGPLVGADIEDQRICVTVAGQTVPAAPAILGQQEQTVSWDGQLDLSQGVPGLEKQGATTGVVRMIELFMQSTTDMSVLSSAAFDVRAPDPADPTGQALTTVQHVSYAKTQPLADPNRIDFAVEQPAANLLDVVTSHAGVIQYRATFTGRPPTTSWATDVTACVYVHITVDLTKM